MPSCQAQVSSARTMQRCDRLRRLKYRTERPVDHRCLGEKGGESSSCRNWRIRVPPDFPFAARSPNTQSPYGADLRPSASTRMAYPSGPVAYNPADESSSWSRSSSPGPGSSPSAARTCGARTSVVGGSVTCQKYSRAGCRAVSKA